MDLARFAYELHLAGGPGVSTAGAVRRGPSFVLLACCPLQTAIGTNRESRVNGPVTAPRDRGNVVPVTQKDRRAR